MFAHCGSYMSEIARLVIEQYNRLPRKGKPLIRDNGVREWTVLAGIVVEFSDGLKKCVALATGVKAQPNSQIEGCGGKILHDCHAEVLAIRAFNHFCMLESLSEGLRVFMYVSAPPCGDASMCLLSGESWSQAPNNLHFLRGREHFHILGAIRTKPGRADSNPTMSKSCTDKLCFTQSKGLFLTPTKHALQKNIYLTGLVTPKILNDYDRAFSRFKPVHKFELLSTNVEFEDYHPDSGKPTPLSIIWNPFTYEVISNGAKQGSRKQIRPSSLSRLELMKLALQIRPTNAKTYYEIKQIMGKQVPQHWQRTATDDFSLVDLT